MKKSHRKEYFENRKKSVAGAVLKKAGAVKGKGNGKQLKKNPNKRNFVTRHVPEEDPDEEFDDDDEEIHSSECGSIAGRDDEEESPKPKAKPAKFDDPTQRFRADMVKEKKEQKSLSKGMRKRRIEQLQEENEQEDKLIKKLEKKLKIDHTRAQRAVPKCFDDGFDYILEMCLPENIGKMYEAAREANETGDLDDDFADDLKIATGKENKLQKIEKKYFDMDSEGEDSELEEEDSDDNVQELPTKTVKNSKFSKNSKKPAPNKQPIEEDSEEDDSVDGDDFSDLDDSGSDIGGDGSDLGASGSEDGDEQSDEENSIKEDIYGRKRDKQGNVVKVEEPSTKYVPPHLRNKESGDDAKRTEQLQRLRRLLKGSINRLAEQNIHKIASEIEQLYMQNSRHDMNETITKLLTEAMVGRSLSPERMVLEHCLLIAVLHGNVGTEVGAHFQLDLVKRFAGLAQELLSLPVEDKELDNVVQLLCHLYTYKVFDCSLIFEMLERLTVDLVEKGIECVLLVLKAVGFALRKDDPLALKEFIGEVQKKAQSAPAELRDNTRLKFMLDILLAVKNNNVNKIPNYDDTVSQQLRKVLKTVLGPGKYVSTLKIPMEDLLMSDERGKWWVVGSAWSGKSTSAVPSGVESKIQSIVNSDSISQKLLALAKKHRMSTEDRKNVFCIIMGAEDYLDAFEKLLHLGIKDHKVIVSVLIHCCLAEKSYNPYYAALAQKFCHFDRKYQLGFQYSAWDRIKDIESLKQFQITNFAKFIAHLIMEGGQPLSVLKVVEFGSLNKPTMKFVRQILLTILMKDEQTCRNVSSSLWSFPYLVV